MAYDYNKSKKLYEQMNEQQQQQFAQQNKNDANFQQFMNDYTNDANRINKVSTPAVTSPYQNQWAGNYSYNQQTGYYEKAQWNYQNQWEWQYVYDNKTWYYQNTTKPSTDINQNFNTGGGTNNQNFYWDQNNVNNTWTGGNTGNFTGNNTNLTGNNGYNYTSSFDEAVLNKLKSAYWISSMEEFKQRYPEQYESLAQSLESVRWVRDATNPERRALLEWELQGIIWAWVWAWSDWSKLNLLENTIMNKFQDGDRVKQDMQNIVKLQTEWKSIEEIANQMWISPDQVQQAILAYNWLDNKLWEYYKLKSDVASEITEPFDKKMDRAEIEKNIALERANRQVERLKEDFDTAMERQQKANEVNLHNADFLSWQYGYWFSKRGIEWLQYTAQQAQNIIDDLVKNYDRSNQQLADWIADIIRNWERYNEDLMEASEDALTQAKNNYTSNMLAIQQQYGTVGLQAQQALSQNVQSFITQAESIYDNALNRQQQNLSNLITNASNLNALNMQNLTLRQAKIEQFQSEALTMNRSQLQQLANQIWMSSEEFGDLANYQAQAVANELNGYLPWAWVQFQQQIQSYLDSWYTPQQTMQAIMNSADFQAMQQAANGSNEYAISGNYIYNKNTWEYQQLWSDDNWAISWDYKINKTTWETVALNWGNVWWNNYVTAQTVDGQTYWVSEKTYNGLVDFYNSHQTWTQWWQCGKFVNDYLESIGVWRIFTDPITDKQAQINTPEWYKPQVWDVVIMDSPTSKKYGHVAIVTAVDGDKITTLESNKKWEEQVFSRTIDTSKQNRLGSQIFGYYHPDGVATNVGSGMLGNWWDVSDYDINTAVMRIGRQAYWANISDSESKRVESVLRDWASMWKNQTEILYDVLWMKISNNLEQATPFIDIMVQNSDKDGLSAYNLVGFSDFINKWEFEKAMNLVEQAVAKERWGNYASDLSKYENGSKYAYTKWDEMIDAINKQTAKLWIVAGRVTDKWSKVMWDKDFQKLKSSIVNYIADWRHEMLWSATTETELKMIDDLIPSITDNPANTITKIKEFQDYWLNKYNQTRWNLYLPSVTKDSVLDKDKRVQLYLWWTSNNWNNISAIQLLQNQLNNQSQGRIRAWWTMSTGKKL